MPRLYGLDALRGIAALVVMIHHLARIYGLPIPPLHPGLAVDLFFILSGFVMTRTYEERMRIGLTTSAFLALRYRRLFAALAVGSSLGLLWALVSFGASQELLLAYLLILGFLPAAWMSNCYLLNGPAWSLSWEILANAIHVSVFARTPTIGLFGLWFGLTAGFVATFTAGLSYWTENIGGIVTLLPRELSCYVMGILLFRRYGDKPLGKQPFLAVCLFPILLWFAFLGKVPELIATIVAAPLLVRASMSLGRAQWATWIGALSYPLYATHMPVVRLALLAGMSPVIAATWVVAVAVAVTLVFEIKRRPVLRETPA